jgi:hypothetical protein
MGSSLVSIRWISWFRWLLLMMAALLAGLIVFILVGSILGEAGEHAAPAVFGAFLGAIFGTAFGVAQWFFLRRFLSNTIFWIPATIVSFTLAAATIFGLLEGDSQETSLLLRISHGFLLGLILGVAQWLVLRNWQIPQSYLWIVFSILGWILGEVAGVLLSDLTVPPLDLLALFLVGSTLPGIGMVWLLKKHFSYSE